MNMSVHINHCTAFLTTFIYISAYFSCRHILQSPYISGCPFLAQDYPIKTRILSVSGANLNSVTYFFRTANILIEVNDIYLDTLQDTLPKIEKVGLLSYSSPLENMFSSLRTSVDIVWHVSVQFLKFIILSSTHTNHFAKLWWFLGILL